MNGCDLEIQSFGINRLPVYGVLKCTASIGQWTGWRDDDPSAVANRGLSHAPAGRLSKCAGGSFDLRAWTEVALEESL